MARGGRVGRRGRFDNLAEIRTLDPYDDADRDLQLLVDYQRVHPTYPRGYRPDQSGPRKMLAELNRTEEHSVA